MGSDQDQDTYGRMLCFAPEAGLVCDQQNNVFDQSDDCLLSFYNFHSVTIKYSCTKGKSLTYGIRNV